jgi:acyl-CoA reductase-like NAD-dependent aldehyde dehydrogenase
MGGKGYFYKPTVFRNVRPKMRITEEEVFGPVAPIILADNDSDTKHCQ